MKEQEEWRAVLVCVAAKNQRCSEETVFTALNNYLQIGNRTGILMSNGETVCNRVKVALTERFGSFAKMVGET